MPLTNRQFSKAASQRGPGRIAVPALFALAVLSGCAEADTDPSYNTPDGGWPLVVDSGVAGGGGLTGGTVLPVPGGTGGTLSGTVGGSLSGTLAGTAGGSVSGTAGGSVSGTAGGTVAGTAGGTVAGTAGGTVAGTAGGTVAGTAGGTLAGLAGGTTGGIIGGLGGIIGGLGGTMGGSTGPVTPLDPSVKQPDASKLPKVSGTCPDLSRDGSIMVAGSTVRIWVGSKPGPVYLYFHGTGSDPGEVDQALPGATSGVKTNGGIVASWDVSNEKGDSTGSVWTVWFTGDYDAADQIIACGIQKGIVDTGRIHVSGYSAGGLQTGNMLFGRSNYIASGIIYSGGKGFGATKLQDPSNAPAVLGAHGAAGDDWLILDFHDETMAVEKELKGLGAFAMDCDDGGSHIDFAFGRAGVGGKALQFFKDHPYNTKPSPYASAIPSGYPSNCKLVQ